MKTSIFAKAKLRTVGEYAGAVLLCLLILVCVMKLWRADLRVPFEYGGDSLFYGMVIKGTIENGWYLKNQSLGAPGQMELHDFPSAENFHMLIIKGMSLFTSDYALILNLYFLLTFPLTVMSSLYVLRQFNISYPHALLGSLLYAFIPYHFFRNEHHFFIAAYYLLPLVILVALRVYGGQSLLQLSPSKRRLGIHLRDFNSVFSLVVCVAMGSSGVYYPFFSCFLLLIAGVFGSIFKKSTGPLLSSLFLITVIFSFVIINHAPSIIYAREHGTTKAFERVHSEAEVYGLKISQMLLPITNHRVKALADLKNRYNSAPLVNENDNVTLGLIGSIGFLLLVWRLLYRTGGRSNSGSENTDRLRLLDQLSVLNISAVLLGTIGGFGVLFALVATPKIRTYNRLSIFIAFLSLFAVCLWLDNFARSRLKSRHWRVAYYVALGLVLLIGIFDQTNKGASFRPKFDRLAAMRDRDREFARQIEAAVPPRAMIFQLPYHAFPEGGNIERMPDYAHLRLYVNSKNLRWSYGAIRERTADQWQKNAVRQPPEMFLQTLAIAGFEGIYLDREGYRDSGLAMETALSNALTQQPITSADQKRTFFTLGEYRERLRASYTPEEWNRKRDFVINPLLLKWEGGFSDLEKTEQKDWRWCSSQGVLKVTNDLQQPRTVQLDMVLATGYSQMSNLLIESPFFSERLQVNNSDKPFSRTVTIPPGTFTITFTCDAPRINEPRDPRFLVFQVANFRLRDVP
jgi:phosphoglycerol transferase